ncbi:hypothetical protein B0I33_102658 [Prauserella shujinwangii]|uniref:Uncharacterized protein n=1 Tax=Prauserella shujinwangii TaxID=1453103 RepID=A0A2T0M1S0_9PSEU|nr:hypothetical protein [Prauserella shujinwangii]PRX50535.1 hypothetical protein B0I33_102658 [Prauserella shujinwangii]
MPVPEPADTTIGPGSGSGRGLAIASLALSPAGLVLALATWAAWLFVRPQLLETLSVSWLTIVFLLVLGALWFAMLPVGTLGLVFGLLAGARSPGSGSLPRVGALVALGTLATAVAGAFAFVYGVTDWAPTARVPAW